MVHFPNGISEWSLFSSEDGKIGTTNLVIFKTVQTTKTTWGCEQPSSNSSSFNSQFWASKASAFFVNKLRLAITHSPESATQCYQMGIA